MFDMDPSARRWILLSALLFVGACTGNASGDEETSQPPQQPASAWDRVTAGIEEDGVPLDTALAAFTLAIGELPDVPVPEGERVEIPSGSGAVRWVLSHWDELSAPQQVAVESYLLDGNASGASGGVVLAMSSPLVEAAADEQALLGLIDQVQSKIASNLGRSLDVPIELHLAPSLIDGDALATAVGTNSTGGFFGQMAKCTITITKSGVSVAEGIVDGVPSNEITALMAHEVFHCFQEAEAADLGAAYARPAWVIEGTAEWVGETIAGGSELAAWGKWLEIPLIDLFKREYSALGFYAHLQEHGANVWFMLDDFFDASDAGSESAYAVALAAGGPDVLATWGPGAYLDASHGPNWDQDGPGIQDLDYPGQTAFPAVSDGNQIQPFADRLAADIWNTDLQAEVVTLAGSGYGMILLPDDAELTLPDALGTVLCTKEGGCTCPEGSPGAGAVFRLTQPGPTRIGLTGHLKGTKLDIRGWTLEDFCDQNEIGPCFVGVWESYLYEASGQIVLPGSGGNILLTIDETGQAEIDFGPSIPIWSRVDAERTPWVRVTQVGSARFEVDPNLTSAVIASGYVSGYHLEAEVQLGDQLVDAGEGFSSNGPAFGPGVTLDCDSNNLTWTGAGGIASYEFLRMPQPAEELPPVPDDAEPIAGSGGPGGEGGEGPPPPPPDWGKGLDACLILALDEVAQLGPAASQPASEDEISTQFLHQCTYPGVVAFQVTPPTTPEFMESGAETLDLDVVVIDGIGEWARAFVTPDDNVIGTPGSVFTVIAGTSKGTVSLVPWETVTIDSPEYQVLLDLLAKGISRI